MSIRKSLHIKIIAGAFLAIQLCNGGDFAAGEYQPTRWERFTQHPIASHIPTALVGGNAYYNNNWLPGQLFAEIKKEQSFNKDADFDVVDREKVVQFMQDVFNKRGVTCRQK